MTRMSTEPTLNKERSVSDPQVNCYSDGEAAFMNWTQALRGQLFFPLLYALTKLGIRATHVTFISMIIGLSFCPVFLSGHIFSAFILLFAHVLLDGLDGPLARFNGSDSNRGSFTDTMADQIVVTATTVTLIHTRHAGLWPGSLYLFFYTCVVGFAFVRNAIAAPYSWLFRPRFIVYACYVVEVYVWAGSLNVILWSASGILVLKTLTGFLTIRNKL